MPSTSSAPAGVGPVQPVAPCASSLRARVGAFVDRALTVIFAALLAAALGFGLFAAAGVRPRVEASDSMSPHLRAGDILWLADIRAAEARIGDVVGFQQDGRIIVHRVTRIERGTLNRLDFVTEGDANTGTERWKVARDGKLARYTGFKIPAIGRATSAVAGPALLVLAALGGLTLAALALRMIWRGE